MFDIIIFNNKHIIKKIKNKEKLNLDDLELIMYNLMGYNKSLKLIEFLSLDKYSSKLISNFIDRENKNDKI